jgi:hypothetical protein
MNAETTAYIARLQRELRAAHIELIKWRGLALASLLAATIMALTAMARAIL